MNIVYKTFDLPFYNLKLLKAKKTKVRVMGASIAVCIALIASCVTKTVITVMSSIDRHRNNVKLISDHKKASNERIKRVTRDIADLYVDGGTIKRKSLIDISLGQITQPSVCFLGVISSGKSTLINALLGSNEPIGRGETTKNVKCVGEIKGIKIWDTPGNSNNFLPYSSSCIDLLKSVKTVVLVVDASINDPLYRDIVDICSGKRKIIIVHTKYDSRENPSGDLSNMRRECSLLGISEDNVFPVSSHNVISGKKCEMWQSFCISLLQ